MLLPIAETVREWRRKQLNERQRYRSYRIRERHIPDSSLASLILVYSGFNSIERRLEIIEGDLKQFFKDLSRHDAEIAALKEKAK